MLQKTPPTKGERSRARVVESAYRLARQVGLQGLSIGELAAELEVSKSGLFAHFGSKEKLQLAVLEFAAEDFRRRVFEPVLRQPRGLPRLRALFEAWLDWAALTERGGCVFLSSAAEYDDQEGPVRDALVGWFEALNRGLEKTWSIAVEEGHLAPGDVAQWADEMHGIVLKFHLDFRLLRRAGAHARARTAFSRLLDGALRKDHS
jgi:AcrR family transcriptional regulator